MNVIDLFAGAGGWDHALRELGLEGLGVENMPEAIATREANGFATVAHDVWDWLDGRRPRYDLMVASPPCPTFSVGGKGAGRLALGEVDRLIRSRAFLDADVLHRFGETHDPRTSLVLVPLSAVARDLPLYIAFEQVAPVLPVWERCAEVLREWGYSATAGVVDAVQYGVPQVRKRAVLLARADGKEARLPAPTHSSFHRNDPDLMDAGLATWGSMADAVGWIEGAVGFPRRYDGRGEALTIGGVEYRGRDLRPVQFPSFTLTEKVRSWQWLAGDRARRMTVPWAQALQTFPEDFTFEGSPTKQFLQIANAIPPLLAWAILRELLA